MRKIKLALLLFFCATTLCAQYAAPSEEDKTKGKEINNIKRSGDAAYADVYQEAESESEALTEAEEKSKAMLQAHVIEIFAKRLGMSKKDVQDIWAVIESRCKHVVVKRGDLYRVFTYVMKSQFDPDYEPKVKPEPKPEPAAPVKEETSTEKKEVIAETIVAAAEEVVEEKTVAEEVVEVKKEEAAATETTTTAVAEKVVEKVVENVVEEAVVEKKEEKAVVEEPKKEEVKPVIEEAVVEDVVTPAPEVLVPELCQKMIATKAFKPLMKFLNQQKTQQILMFGNANKMQYHDKCYIVVVERASQTIVAVLDKGDSERMNFVSKKMDHYRNYKGGNYSCVFVQVY